MPAPAIRSRSLASGKWAGHHIFDLGHGGAPVARDNVLPVPGDVHGVFNKEYPACYAPGGKWLTPGPERPYGNLDPDLRAFYLHCDGCTLFETVPDAKYRVLPLDEIQRARSAIRGSDEEEDGAASHYTLVDMQDTNFVILDVAAAKNGRYPLLDAFHETYPDEAPCIAESFEEFLAKSLRSGNRAFWLSDGPPEK